MLYFPQKGKQGLNWKGTGGEGFENVCGTTRNESPNRVGIVGFENTGVDGTENGGL